MRIFSSEAVQQIVQSTMFIQYIVLYVFLMGFGRFEFVCLFLQNRAGKWKMRSLILPYSVEATI